jgi:hypothetical protein
VPTVRRPEWLVATDASGWGWGYFAVHNDTGEVRTHGAQWSYGFAQRYGDRLGVSTFTEPQAVINSLCHLLSPSAPTRVRVLTDNTVTQASYQRGFNTHSFHINGCLQRLQTIFGNEFHFDFGYLPGECNPADGWSRGMIAENEEARDQEIGAELSRIAGSAVLPQDIGSPARDSQLLGPASPT